jgi:RNA polymerase sigma-70 factor, ECF subfamily
VRLPHEPALTAPRSSQPSINNLGPAAVIRGVASDDRRLAEIEALYRSRFQRFLRVAMAMTGDYQQALDAVQDGFGDAIRSRHRYRGEGSLEAWVWRAVVNAARDARRSWRPAEARHEPLTSTNDRPEPSPELRAAIAALPERQRLVLFLRHYADLDYRSIGTALGIQTGTVSATLSAAHASLRRTLSEVES